MNEKLKKVCQELSHAAGSIAAGGWSSFGLELARGEPNMFPPVVFMAAANTIGRVMQSDIEGDGLAAVGLIGRTSLSTMIPSALAQAHLHAEPYLAAAIGTCVSVAFENGYQYAKENVFPIAADKVRKVGRFVKAKIESIADKFQGKQD